MGVSSGALLGRLRLVGSSPGFYILNLHLERDILAVKEGHFVDNLLQQLILSGRHLLHRSWRSRELLECLLKARDPKLWIGRLLTIGHSDDNERGRYHDVFSRGFHKRTFV